ncbi:MAG TPA: regulatory protein RecX [Puia sp.]|nr:regulatory protein RecX [Puia sp.]
MTESGSSNFRVRISVEKALQKLKHYCGYQERSHSEARQKLYSLGLFKKEVDELISQLIEEGYLNEERFARQFASGKSRIKGWGRQKIQYELRQRGISEFCIMNALRSLDTTEYEDGFNRLASKKWTSLLDEKNIFVKKSKWQEFLLQRGFEPELIKKWSFPDDKTPD